MKITQAYFPTELTNEERLANGDSPDMLPKNPSEEPLVPRVKVRKKPNARRIDRP